MLHVTIEARSELRDRLLRELGKFPAGGPSELGFRLVSRFDESAPEASRSTARSLTITSWSARANPSR